MKYTDGAGLHGNPETGLPYYDEVDMGINPKKMRHLGYDTLWAMEMSEAAKFGPLIQAVKMDMHYHSTGRYELLPYCTPEEKTLLLESRTTWLA